MPASLVAALPAVCRAPIKYAVRTFGAATSGLRPLPDFLIIGAHRAGTTSLHDFLQRHPCIVGNFPRVQRIKGVRFFDEHFDEGVDWYRSHFATIVARRYQEHSCGHPVLTGESSPYYLFHPLAAERAANVVPHAKLIVLLRNPIDRAYSHWRRERRDGREPLAVFEDALAAEPERLHGEEAKIIANPHYYSYAHENFSYVTQGFYLDALVKWLERFPRNQLFIASSERFLANPQQVYDDVLCFLGLPSFRLSGTAPSNVNPANEPVRSDTRAALAGQFAPHNRRLEHVLGLEFGWDAGVDGHYMSEGNSHETQASLHVGADVPSS